MKCCIGMFVCFYMCVKANTHTHTRAETHWLPTHNHMTNSSVMFRQTTLLSSTCEDLMHLIHRYHRNRLLSAACRCLDNCTLSLAVFQPLLSSQFCHLHSVNLSLKYFSVPGIEYLLREDFYSNVSPGETCFLSCRYIQADL